MMSYSSADMNSVHNMYVATIRSNNKVFISLRVKVLVKGRSLFPSKCPSIDHGPFGFSLAQAAGSQIGHISVGISVRY